MARPFCADTLNGSYIWNSITDFLNIFYDTTNYDVIRDDTIVPPDSLVDTMRPTCSEDTLFVWVPSIMLLMFSLIELNTPKRNANKVAQSMPYTIYFVTKMAATILLAFICLIRIFYWTSRSDTSLDGQFGHVQWKDSFAPVFGDFIRTVSLLYILFLLWIHRRKGIHTSKAIFMYLVLNIIPNIYTLFTLMNQIFFVDSYQAPSLYLSPFAVVNQPFMVATKLIFIILLGYLFMLYCFTDNDANMVKRTNIHYKYLSPEHSASFFSSLTFEWFTDLVVKAVRVVSLQQEHLWMLSQTNTAKTIIVSLEKILSSHKRAHPSEPLNLITLMLRLYTPQLILIAIIKLFASLFIFVNPIVLNKIITFMNPYSEEPTWKGYFYCSLMLFSPMFESFFNSQYEYHINQVTMRMKVCITSEVYKKSLRLSNQAKQQYTTGEIVNLVAVDSQRIVDFFNVVNTVWSSPLQVMIGIYLLWQQLSYASMAGFAYMVAMVLLNFWLTKMVRNIQVDMMKEKDSRSKLMDEILNGIKVIKLNSLENYFERKVLRFREQEVYHLRRYAYVNGFINFLFSSAAFFVGLFSFVTFILASSENILDANRAFVSLALFNIIRMPLAYLPLLFSYFGIAMVSISRINKYLNASEIDPKVIEHLSSTLRNTSIDNSNNNKNKTLTSERQTKKSFSRAAIKINNGAFSWLPDEPTPVLNKINLEVKKGQLVAIVGGVGSGKSSFVSAILGEMIKINGQIEINGRIAYVPQEAWIRNATIRENILLDKVYDEKKYASVLEACALNLDLAMFAAGDHTEVGEKGINLSGGQKQRISIARAVYSDADIVILDDPLSALDAHVSKHIFTKLIGPGGYFQNKTRLLVTNKLSLLSQVDQVVYISKGEIQEIGPFDQLIDNKGPFSEYVTEYFLSQSNTDEYDEDELQFITKMEPQLQPIVKKLEQSRGSSSLKRSISTSTSGSHSVSSVRSFRRSQSASQASSYASNLSSTRTVYEDKQGKLIENETIAEGSVKLIHHKKYFRTIGYWTCVLILLSLAISNLFQVFSSLWLSEWSNDSLYPELINDIDLRNTRLIVYALLGISEVLFSFFGTMAINLAAVIASKVLHNQMLGGILRAPMSFFDTTPMGRIMNRFSRDIDIIDLQLSLNIRMLSMQVFRTIVALALISLEAPIILTLLLPLTIFYYFVQRLYITTSRGLKRIEAVTRSPIYNMLSESISGTASIHTYGLGEWFVKEMHKRIDINNQSYWLIFAAARWLAIRLEFFSYSIVFVSTVFAIASRGTLSPGLAGLAISYSLNITSILNLFIRGLTELETNFVSVERVVEYTSVAKEHNTIPVPQQQQQQPLQQMPFGWPTKGKIIYRNYSTQYRPGLKLCLKKLNLTIYPGNKVAVIGRTGSGKSSLALTLFRILNPIEGTIYIDNVDVRQIELHQLRNALTIVPQEPVLFSGTLRENIDLYNQYSDSEILDVLKTVNMNEFLESIGNDLNYIISGSVSDNLSSGQRQLICLARAMIRKRKIVVFDEATAMVDYETDQVIHNLIFSKQFAGITVLMIAHRLDNIMDYDQILVMKNGEVGEYDSPQRLAADHNSAFYSMAKEAKVL